MKAPAYLVFSSKNDHWIAPILRGQFNHVHVLIYDDPTNIWMLHNYGRTGHELKVFGSGDVDVRAFSEREGGTVVAIDADTDTPIRLPLILNNCVGMAKALTGLRTWAVTPQQLYRHVTPLDKGVHACQDFALS
jgi:hypothetical protein